MSVNSVERTISSISDSDKSLADQLRSRIMSRKNASLCPLSPANNIDFLKRIERNFKPQSISEPSRIYRTYAPLGTINDREEVGSSLSSEGSAAPVASKYSSNGVYETGVVVTNDMENAYISFPAPVLIRVSSDDSVGRHGHTQFDTCLEGTPVVNGSKQERSCSRSGSSGSRRFKSRSSTPHSSEAENVRKDPSPAPSPIMGGLNFSQYSTLSNDLFWTNSEDPKPKASMFSRLLCSCICRAKSE